MSETFEQVERDGKTYYRVPANPSRTTSALANLSYGFEQAIADLVDNSVAAHATIIHVSIEQLVGGKIQIKVGDNGIGISKDRLPAAIQYGAAARNNDSSLGVYGFGLKTACQSFTTSFSVVSRSADEKKFSMITFDQKVIDQYDDFLFASEDAPSSYEKDLVEISNDGTGTLVVTENADRLINADPEQYAQRAKKFISNKKSGKIFKTKQHLRKTFQRFLDTDDSRVPNLQIFVNDEEITPWDAFCQKEGDFLEAEEIIPGLRTRAGKEGGVILRGFIVPSEIEFKDQVAGKDAEIGPSSHGVYVYRENRLIQQATYFGLFKRDTHMVNLRVEFSYEGALDELFQTSLQKGSMVLGDLEDLVREFLRPLIREVDAQSRGRSRRKGTGDLHALSQKRITAAENRVKKAIIEAIDEKSAKAIGKYGEVILPIPSSTDEDQGLPINPVESIDDGILWQMRLKNFQQVVDLNKGHDFYSKVYLPNKDHSIAIQGLDILLWSLAITEANCAIPEYRKQFKEFRYEVSRTLRELVESLPEPRYDDSDADADADAEY